MNQDIKPYLIAHRGGKHGDLENSLDAFKKAIELDYDGIECDIQPDINHELVVFHDLDLNRLGNYNKFVKDLPYSVLKDIVLKKTMNDVVEYGNIFLLKDLLLLFQTNNKILFIELKETCKEKDVFELFSLLKLYQIEEARVVIIGNLSVINLLGFIRKEHPFIKLQFLARTDYTKYMDYCLDNSIGIDIASSVLDSCGLEYVQKFKEKNLSTNVWVVNSLKEYNKYKELHFDYITTDVLFKGKIEEN